MLNKINVSVSVASYPSVGTSVLNEMEQSNTSQELKLLCMMNHNVE